MALPASRNALKKAQGQETCPHCLQAGGSEPDIAESGAHKTPLRSLPPSARAGCSNSRQRTRASPKIRGVCRRAPLRTKDMSADVTVILLDLSVGDRHVDSQMLSLLTDFDGFHTLRLSLYPFLFLYLSLSLSSLSLASGLVNLIIRVSWVTSFLGNLLS